MPVHAKSERVIGPHAVLCQFKGFSEVVDAVADVGPQGFARCNRWVDRDKRTAELGAQPSGKEAAKTCSNNKCPGIQLQP